jgi:hypothetical protein
MNDCRRDPIDRRRNGLRISIEQLTVALPGVDWLASAPRADQRSA